MAQHPGNKKQRKQSSNQQTPTLAEEIANKSQDGNTVSMANAKTYNMVVDDVPYIVKAVPFSFNGEQRF